MLANMSLMAHAKTALLRRARKLSGRAGILGSRLDPAQTELLARMRADNAAAHAPFRASPIWTELAREFDAWFATEGIADVETQEMNAFFSAPTPGNPKLLRYACWMLFNDLRRRDRRSLIASIPATGQDGETIFSFDGCRVSWDQLISIDALYAIAEADPRIFTAPVIVADLGAGWGRIGHALKSANRAARYIVFDLPEALLVSQTHLPKRLPGSAVLSYQDSRDGPLTRDRLGAADLAFLGAHDLARVEDGAIDILVNIGSFQEMSAAQVVAYFGLIDRKVAGTLYVQQLRDAGTHGYRVGEIDGLAAYPFPIRWTRDFCRSPAWSDLYFEAAFAVHHASKPRACSTSISEATAARA